MEPDTITLSVDEIIEVMSSTVNMSDKEIIEMHDICKKKVSGKELMEEGFSKDYYQFGLLMSFYVIMNRNIENLAHFYDEEVE